jgi:P pilus assembly chaperone PapD
MRAPKTHNVPLIIKVFGAPKKLAKPPAKKTAKGGCAHKCHRVKAHNTTPFIIINDGL